jgi:hypothetical protein
VRLDAQRMVDGGGGEYTINGMASVRGITVTPASGGFADNGSATVDIAVTVAKSVPDESYAVYLYTKVGDSIRISSIIVVVSPVDFDE